MKYPFSFRQLLEKIVIRRRLSKRPPTESFCILPWIHIYSTTKGTCQLCCDSVDPTDYATEDNEVVHLYQHDITEIWNCKTVKAFRVRMLTNDKIKEALLKFMWVPKSAKGAPRRPNAWVFVIEVKAARTEKPPIIRLLRPDRRQPTVA